MMTAAIDHARLFVRVYFGVWVLTLAAAASAAVAFR